MSTKYWKVYDVLGPDQREYCGIFRSVSAETAIRLCRSYHAGQVFRRGLGRDLVAEETTDERLYYLAVVR